MQTINEIMPILQRFMKVISHQFGDNCEVVLHDLTKGLDHSIVAIENGHVTGRREGKNITT